MAGGNGNDTYVVDSAGDVDHRGGRLRHRHGGELGHPHARRQCREADADRQRRHQRHRQRARSTPSSAIPAPTASTAASAPTPCRAALGNDTYVVDSGGDVGDRGGRRRRRHACESSVTHTLAANVEKLTLTGSAGTNGTGNALANTIIGNSGANRIDGDALNDTLTGGSGNDDFVFDDGDGADTVTDFQNGADQFDLTAVAGVDDIGDLTIIDNGATVTVNYGTGSFTIANLADPAPARRRRLPLLTAAIGLDRDAAAQPSPHIMLAP